MGGSSIGESTITSIRGDIKDLTQKYKVCNDRLGQVDKDIAEHDDILAKLLKDTHAKASSKDHNDLAKDVDRLDAHFKQLLDQVNSIKVPDPVVASDDSARYQALERMLVSHQRKMEQSEEDLNKRMKDANKLTELIKEEVDAIIEEQEKQLVKTISKANLCEVRIGALENQLKDYHAKPAITGGDGDFKEAIKAVKALENKVEAHKHDFMDKLAAIEYQRLPLKLDKQDLEALESSLRDKIFGLDKKIMKLRTDLQSISKLHDRVVKTIEKDRAVEDKTDKDEVSLLKKPLMGFKCANCERDLNNLEQTSTEFFNWKKLPHQLQKRKKMNMNLHSIGQGFSKMLQTFSTDDLHKDQSKTNILSSDHIIEESDHTLPLPKNTARVIRDVGLASSGVGASEGLSRPLRNNLPFVQNSPGTNMNPDSNHPKREFFNSTEDGIRKFRSQTPRKDR